MTDAHGNPAADARAREIAAALDEFGEAFKDAMTFDYEAGTPEAEARGQRLTAARDAMSPYQMAVWLKQLLAERERFQRLEHAAFMVAKQLDNYKHLSPVLSDLHNDLKGALAALDADASEPATGGG